MLVELRLQDEENDTSIAVRSPRPDIKKHASPALLYALAVLMLDRDGTIDAVCESLLLEENFINEVDATNRINILLNEPVHESN